MNKSVKDKVLELKKKCSFDTYKVLISEVKPDSMFEYSKLGISLHSITKFHDIDLILRVLDKIKVQEGHQLILERQVSESFGQYYLYIISPDGAKKSNIFDYINVEESVMGAWQSYLLYTLWHVLPLYDHSCYSARKFIFLNQDIESISIDGKDPYVELGGLDTQVKIVSHESQYYISCCYWNRFRGLSRELMELTIQDGKVTQFFDVRNEILYEYDCNIMI